MKKVSFIVLLLFFAAASFAQDTLIFRISNPGTSIKRPNGKYLRKTVRTDSGWLALDHNAKKILVARGFYTDTNFTSRLHCHISFDEDKGYRKEIRCYQNGKLNGTNIGFSETQDTMWTKTYVSGVMIAAKDFPGYETEVVIFQKIEIEASFPKGKQAWLKYISDNLKYPKKAKKKKIEGTVLVSFIISKEGKITDVKVIESVHPLLDAEAIRVIQSSPDWIPGEQNGRKVRAFYKQQVSFKL